MKSPRIRHIIWLLLLWLMPSNFVVMGQNVNGENTQKAENVQDTIAPRYSVRKTVPGTLKDLTRAFQRDSRTNNYSSTGIVQ